MDVSPEQSSSAPADNTATATAPATPPQPGFTRRLARRALRLAGYGLVGLAALLLAGWGALAVCFTDLTGAPPRFLLACVYFAAWPAALLLLRPRRYALAACAALFLIVLAFFFTRSPSNDRQWREEVSQLAWADVIDDQVTVHNVRNFDYRSATDFTPSWETRTYDLCRLTTVDYILVHWGSDAIAHVIASFGFDDGQYLCVSIEARKERTESYSAIQGFFRQFELIYVFADERDVLRLRTNYLNEDVYLYHTRVTPDHARRILLSYLARANSLRERPEFYNALTTNCATSVLPHARAGGAKGQFSWQVLLSGYSARQAYRNGVLDDSIPYEELRKRSYVNPVARQLDRDPDFSRKIRAALPILPGTTITGPSTQAMAAQVRGPLQGDIR